MADAPQTTVADPQLDHLAHLHRMSRTAGLGSSDYTAVNVAAVVAVLIGAASALALISPIFLFLPVIGVVIAVLAIVQIRSSNGTQTGFGLAVLALVLSVAMSGFTGFQSYRAYGQTEADKVTLDTLISHFGDLVAQGKLDEAYRLTDARFQDQFSRAEFGRVFEQLSSSAGTGKVVAFHSNKLFNIDTDADSQLRMAIGYAFADTEKLHDGELRFEVRYRNTDGVWKIYAIPQFFAAKPAPGAAAAGGGAGGVPTGPAGPPAPR